MVWTPKPSFQAAWKVGHATIGSENAGWTTSKGGHPCNAGTAHNGFLQKRLEESLLNCLSCPTNDLINRGTEGH